MLNQNDTSSAAREYFTERLADYPAISGNEIKDLLLESGWFGFRTGRTWTFFEDGTIDDDYIYAGSDFCRSWRMDGDLLTYSGKTTKGEVFNSYSVHKFDDNNYFLVQDGAVTAFMSRETD